MSHVPGDDEVKRLLAMTEADDSSGKPNLKKPKDVKKETPKNDDYNEYDISDDKELDDKNW